jgi:hypothetical protein
VPPTPDCPYWRLRLTVQDFEASDGCRLSAMVLPPIPIPDGTETQAPTLRAVENIADAKRRRQDQPFFEILPRPRFPDCDHSKRGVQLDRTTRTVRCLCGAQIDPFDALLVYAHAEERLIGTKRDLEAHKQEEAAKRTEQAARRPFLRDVGGFTSVYNPAPPEGDGALIGFDVQLSCGHRVRWPSRGKRHPRRHLTCEICLRVDRAKQPPRERNIAVR